MEFLVDGKKVRYNPYNMKKDRHLGDGYEVEAYQINDKVVKFFHKYPKKKIIITKESVEKMKKIKTKRILLPTDALLDKKRNIRGYQMDYIEDLDMDSYFGLDKDQLVEEHKSLKNDIELLSDNKVQLGDLNHANTVYNNGLYLIDPGSYFIDSSVDENQAYGINIDILNEFLIYEVIKNYHLVKYSDFDAEESFSFCRQISREYKDSDKSNVLDFLSGIEENSLSEFVEKRVNGKK